MIIDTHSDDKLLNIYTGEESPDDVNVHLVVDIGKEEMKAFKKRLPQGFRERLTTKVSTMVNVEEKKKKETEGQFNAELILS